MAPLFPTTTILQDTFSSQILFARPTSTPSTAPKSTYVPLSRRFSTWSAVDDVRSKAGVLSSEAQKEIAKASSAAQAKTGQIELYSAKYYAACTLGGLIACVSIQDEEKLRNSTNGSGRVSPILPLLH